jgi:hypothetical protein
MKVPRFVTLILLGFVVLGVGLLVGSAFAYRSTRTFLTGAVSAEGTIVAYAESRDPDGHLSYYPVVSFRAKDGQRVEFQARTGGHRRGPLGERVAVLYDPRNPHEAAIHSFFSLWFASLLLLALGLGFAGIGAVLLVTFGRQAGSRGGAEAERLRAEGRKLTTTVQDVVVDGSYAVNGRNPYRIVTHWHDPASDEVHVFESERIWFNPRDYIPSAEIDVYVDPFDMAKYHMDISFLPRLAGRG